MMGRKERVFGLGCIPPFAVPRQSQRDVEHPGPLVDHLDRS
jgi:hypothetical protein